MEQPAALMHAGRTIQQSSEQAAILMTNTALISCVAGSSAAVCANLNASKLERELPMPIIESSAILPAGMACIYLRTCLVAVSALSAIQCGHAHINKRN